MSITQVDDQGVIATLEERVYTLELMVSEQRSLIDSLRACIENITTNMQ